MAGAKGKPFGKPFVKGQSGNPQGRRPDKLAAALRKFTLKGYREAIELALTGNLGELKAFAEDPLTPAFQVGLAMGLLKSIKAGDIDAIDKIAARIIGKIPDKFEMTGPEGGPIETKTTQTVIILPAKNVPGAR